MQSSDGSMKMLEVDEIEANPKLLLDRKVLKTGMYFRIKYCYFKITGLNPEGLEAKGVSRREYFENR